MKRTILCAVVATVLAPAAAQAQFEVGARTGYAFAMGDVDGSGSMSDATRGNVPIQLDVGYRVGPVVVGAYGSYGFGSVKGLTQENCDLRRADCYSSSLRFGAEVLWPLAAPSARTEPWLGLGLGYERLTVFNAAIDHSDIALRGFEFLVQGGMDWRVGQTGALGLFASFSVGEYTDMSLNDASSELGSKRMHEWLALGGRGSFGVGN